MKMPRKRKSDNDEILELKEKLRKLERDRTRERYRRIRVLSSSSESSASPSPTRQPSRNNSQSRQPSGNNSRRQHRSPSASKSRCSTPKGSSQGACSGAESELDVCAGSSRQVVVHADIHNTRKDPQAQISRKSTDDRIETEVQGVDAVVEPDLSSDILEILGDDPSVTKIFGKDIQKDLAVRFNHLATNGLSKELRKALRKKYPVPANCTLIDAPQINPEVKAAISETAAKRVGGMEQKQKQLASAISCLGEAITLLISQSNADSHMLRLLMDAGRIICDTQYSDSLTRRFFILASLKKEMKDQLLTTKIDSFLFGKDLSDTLKSAKAISKSGAELKQPQTSKQTPWKFNNNRPNNKRNNLNSKAAPLSHRSTGSSRPRPPAPRNQPVSSSKSSQQPYRRSQR